MIGLFINTCRCASPCERDDRPSPGCAASRARRVEAAAATSTRRSSDVHALERRCRRDGRCSTACWCSRTIPVGRRPGAAERLRLRRPRAGLRRAHQLPADPGGGRPTRGLQLELSSTGGRFDPATVRAHARDHLAHLLQGFAGPSRRRRLGRRCRSLGRARRRTWPRVSTVDHADPPPARRSTSWSPRRRRSAPGRGRRSTGGDGHLTYGELDRRGRPRSPAACARRRRAGGRGRRCCLERSRTWWSALLGILEAGGAYVPLDPAYPARAPRAACSRTAASRRSLLVAGRRRCRTCRRGDRRAWTSPPIAADRGAAGATAHAVPASTPPNLAYVIYTSGSTGRPKGVVVTPPATSAAC